MSRAKVPGITSRNAAEVVGATSSGSYPELRACVPNEQPLVSVRRVAKTTVDLLRRVRSVVRSRRRFDYCDVRANR